MIRELGSDRSDREACSVERGAQENFCVLRFTFYVLRVGPSESSEDSE